ncbi:MAG: hypothetical protein JWN65_3524 [Solirubrobacterales bacterium]|nr:hypothetical protein [Solirubrobacterales bacterium]
MALPGKPVSIRTRGYPESFAPAPLRLAGAAQASAVRQRGTAALGPPLRCYLAAAYRSATTSQFTTFHHALR